MKVLGVFCILVSPLTAIWWPSGQWSWMASCWKWWTTERCPISRGSNFMQGTPSFCRGSHLPSTSWLKHGHQPASELFHSHTRDVTSTVSGVIYTVLLKQGKIYLSLHCELAKDFRVSFFGTSINYAFLYTNCCCWLVNCHFGHHFGQVWSFSLASDSQWLLL